MVRIHPDPPIDARHRRRIGAIAQLGERLLCKQEVTGSIPVGSTRFYRRIEECSAKVRPESGPSQCISDSFGCSLTIRKKQGGSGTLQMPDSLGKRLH